MSEINVVIQPLVETTPIEISMTKPGPQGEIGLTGLTGETGADSTVAGPPGADGSDGEDGLIIDQNLLTGVGEIKIWTGTQAEYDSIVTVNEQVIYFVR